MDPTHIESEQTVENTYPKLVRDKIPEIIEREGKVVESRILTDKTELLHYLFLKLLEESEELSKASTTDHQAEEFADVCEVLGSLCHVLGISHEAIERVQNTKRQTRGGFSKHILLIVRPE